MKRAIHIDQVSIMFGKNGAKALSLADEGHSRSEIQAQTGNVLGVHDCSLEIFEGEIMVLMGLSGSGKSTLLRAINRLNPVTRGDILITDHDAVHSIAKARPDHLRAIRLRLVSMVFQQFGLLPWRTVGENVGLGLELAGMKKADREKWIKQELELVGLGEWSDRKVGELSGGMQQRVGLARAFVTGAPILLMDEPFSALDPLIRSRLQDELLDLQSRLKKTIVFVSHDLDEAMKLGNRIAIMEGGRIVQCGTAQDILLNPVNDYVTDFVAHMNPLGVLSAKDVMQHGKPEAGRPLAGTASSSAPVSTLIRTLAKTRGGVIGVINNGAIVGVVTADDIVAAVAKYQ